MKEGFDCEVTEYYSPAEAGIALAGGSVAKPALKDAGERPSPQPCWSASRRAYETGTLRLNKTTMSPISYY